MNKDTMRVTISYKNSEFEKNEREILLKKGFELINNYFDKTIIGGVKFVEYYSNSIKITVDTFKAYEIKLSDIMMFEVTHEK